MQITTAMESIESLDLDAVIGGCKKGAPPQQPPPQQMMSAPPPVSGGDTVSISVNGQTTTKTG